MSQLAWELRSVPQEVLEPVTGEREVLDSPVKSAASAHQESWSENEWIESECAASVTQ